MAYLNRIATAVPATDVHGAFLDFAERQLRDRSREQRLFRRMAAKGGIEHRYSFVTPTGSDGDALDTDRLFVRGRFASTGERMQFFETHAPGLAAEAVDALLDGERRDRVSHLIVTCCTGLAAPGLDLEVMRRCGLLTSVERSMLGFMGCYAAINALRLARHIVRSDSAARVLVVSVELCTLHLQESTSLDELLSFLLWGDGAAACLVTAEPHGFSLDGFEALLADDTHELITWNIRDRGFTMFLSGQVPAAIHDALAGNAARLLGGDAIDAIDLWAVHPGGRSVLDAVERALALPATALEASRETLRRYGNMSSATVLFVLQALLAQAAPGAHGCAMSFGPGLIAEIMRFHAVG